MQRSMRNTPWSRCAGTDTRFRYTGTRHTGKCQRAERLAQNENNHFGIKATPAWIAEGGRFGVYTDDKPNEKFCSYDSVGDSYEHHSRFLKENSRYARCFTLAPDDYKGWTQGIAQAGYASGGKYAGNLQRIIEQNGLQKYDRQVMQEMAAQGRSSV